MAPARRSRACDHAAGEPQALPRDTAGRPSSGSCAVPCVWPSPAAAGSRTGVVRPPAPAAVRDPPRRPCASCGNARPTGRPRAASWRVAPTVRDAQQRCELPHDASEASEVFSDQVLERRIVEHLLGEQLLQPAVLVLQSPQSASLRYFQAAELCLPLVEGRPADPMPPAQLLSLAPCFGLLQNPNDLLFRETALAHRRSPRDRLNYQLEGIPGSRSGAIVAPSRQVSSVRKEEDCSHKTNGAISSHRKLLSSKAMVVNVAETSGYDLGRYGQERRAQANEIRVSAERRRRRNSVGLNAGGMGWVRPGSMDFSSARAGS